jgi:hypothetical protein
LTKAIHHVFGQIASEQRIRHGRIETKPWLICIAIFLTSCSKNLKELEDLWAAEIVRGVWPISQPVY